MKSIRSRILVSFCLAVLVSIAVIEITVSWKLGKSIALQSELLSDEMAAQTRQVVSGHNAMLQSFLADLQNDVWSVVKAVCSDQAVSTNIGSWQLVPLEDSLKNTCAASAMNAGLIFDLEGRLRASYPLDLNSEKVGQFYRDWQFTEKSRQILQTGAGNVLTPMHVVAEFDSDFVRTFRLEESVSSEGGIVVLSGGVISDDFGDPVGVCIFGKVLNQYNRPLAQLYQATGSAAVLYHRNVPIAQAGFGDDPSGAAGGLEISAQFLDAVLKAGKNSSHVLTWKGRRYIANCAPISAYNGDQIGVIATGALEETIVQAREKMAALSGSTRREVQTWLTGIGLACLAAFVMVSILITRGIVGPLNHIISGLSYGADQVSASADQMASASGVLSEGASEQAASIEEMTSSMEEMAAMTRNNSDHTREADALMKQMRRIVEQAAGHMGRLTASMNDISTASEETQKIVKTIDAIAFQTNLLALNAAVEAARAGAAGAGFSVVANEVRNLAKKAAEAAQTTADLIAQTTGKVRDGNGIVESANKIFSEVSTSAVRVSELVSEIADASGEQAQGLDQMNRAMTDMDRVTQENAGSAEESASAAHEMNLQAQHMQQFVVDLLAMAGGNGNGRKPEDTGDAGMDEANHLIAGGGNPQKRLSACLKKLISRRAAAEAPPDSAEI